MKRGKQTKATPAPPLHRSAFLHLSLPPLLTPECHPPLHVSLGPVGGRPHPPPTASTPDLDCSSSLLPHPSPLPSSLTFVCCRTPRPPSRPLANAFQPHIPLTELKSCITLKNPANALWVDIVGADIQISITPSAQAGTFARPAGGPPAIFQRNTPDAGHQQPPGSQTLTELLGFFSPQVVRFPPPAAELNC